MKGILLCLIFSGFCQLALCQSTVPEVVSNSGNHFIAPNSQVSWTLGETVISTLNNGNTVLSQGFHQTRLVVTAIEEEVVKDLFTVDVFPNPVSETLSVSWEDPEAHLDFQLVDVLGHVLLQRTHLSGGQATFNLSQISQGNYFLQVSHLQKNTAKNFKIQIIR